MAYRYRTKGTCAQYIDVEMEGNVVKKVEFFGGCSGNLQGISKLAVGHTYEELKEMVGGIKCGFKATSCPDQLVCAVEEAMAAEK